MPLPSEPLTIQGGCNCRAIRYKVSVPALSERPLHPWSKEPVHLPNIVICHCNDCRRATAGLSLSAICTPMAMVSVSLTSNPSPSTPLSSVRVKPPDDIVEGKWVPASTVFAPNVAPPGSFLAIYKSSGDVSRSFCKRCGTPFAFSRHPMREPWPEMLDIVLGTVDREDLEKGFMVPDRHIAWGLGIDWVKELFGGKLVKHPKSHLEDVVE